MERGEVVAGGERGVVEAEAVELSSGCVEGGGGGGALGGFGVGGTEDCARGGGGSGVGIDVGTEGVERKGGKVEEVREKETGKGGDEVEEERRDRRNVHGRIGEGSVRLDPIGLVRLGLVGWEVGALCPGKEWKACPDSLQLSRSDRTDMCFSLLPIVRSQSSVMSNDCYINQAALIRPSDQNRADEDCLDFSFLVTKGRSNARLIHHYHLWASQLFALNLLNLLMDLII